MSHRPDPLSALSVPDGTTVEEHDIVVEADVIVGGQSTVELGVRAQNVIAGERTTFGGHIEASRDCRLDMWCETDGNVLVGGDAYLGARTAVGGQLVVAGDLDIGDDVTIEEGFEANGWIEIRNPMSTMVLLFVYLSHLLRVGEDDAAQEVVSEVFEDAAESDPLVIPESASVGDDAWRVSTPARVGDDCRLHGNLRAAEIDVGERDEVFGSLRARGPIRVGADSRVHGDVTTRGGEVRIAPGAHVRGDVACEDLQFHEDAVIEGSIRARGEMSIVRGQVDADTDADQRPEGDERADDGAERNSSETRPASPDGPAGDASDETTKDGVVAEDRSAAADGTGTDDGTDARNTETTDDDGGDDAADSGERTDTDVDANTDADAETDTDGDAAPDANGDAEGTVEPDDAATNGSKPSFGTDQ